MATWVKAQTQTGALGSLLLLRGRRILAVGTPAHHGHWVSPNRVAAALPVPLSAVM